MSYFKRTVALLKRTSVPIEGKWQAIDFRPALNVAYYKDFKMTIQRWNYHPEAWKDLFNVEYYGTSVEFDYTVSLAEVLECSTIT